MSVLLRKFAYTPVLGWSISRYETFSRCCRLYFYSYYSRYIPGIAYEKIKRLSALTSVPLEVGNVVHDILESLLKRLQISDKPIDPERFYLFAHQKTREYFSAKEFLESYYRVGEVDLEFAQARVMGSLKNFLGSRSWEWICSKAITTRQEWIIEPDGFGETRLNGLKAYCKMDFLIPVDDCMFILDWKTGNKDLVKHRAQLLGYSAAAEHNLGMDRKKIFPRIIYLLPEYNEFEVNFTDDDYEKFYLSIDEQTREMLDFCSDESQNIPKPIHEFPMKRSQGKCALCRFQELCEQLNF